MMLVRAIRSSRQPLISYPFSQKTWEKIPRPWNVHLEKKHKDMLNRADLKPFPKFLVHYKDTLTIPGMDHMDLFNMYSEFI